MGWDCLDTLNIESLAEGMSYVFLRNHAPLSTYNQAQPQKKDTPDAEMCDTKSNCSPPV